MYMDLNSLNDLLPKFWTSKKCGKHEGLANQHGMLLMKNLLVKPEDLFEQLEKTYLIFKIFQKFHGVIFLKEQILPNILNPNM